MLGAGGMGEVYRARDVRLERTVAIKTLPAALADDADARGRFEREARAVAALNHPHICTLYDVGPDYLVMELVDGQPMAGPLPLPRALELASQVLSALEAAHGAGITHRDLKPANILVTKQGIKLLDFGLAKVGPGGAVIATAQGPMETSSDVRTAQQALTDAYTILGTIPYMSPEQAQGRPVDARSDIFSFGLILYEMVTGKRAFDGDSPGRVIAAILEREAPSIAGAASPVIERVLKRCLAKDPDERWQSARDVRYALAIAGETTAAPAGPYEHRGVAPALAVAAGVLLAAIGLTLWLTESRRSLERRPLSFHLIPPTGTEFQFSPEAGGHAIAPDGQSVAFVATAKGTPRLWLRRFDSLTPRELPGTEGAKLPFWSPDSASLGFFTGYDMRRIEVSGTETTILARTQDSRGGAWNADGTIVFSPNSTGPLYRVSAAGSTPVALTTVSTTESNHRWPKFLPGGRQFLYFVQGAEPGVYLATLDRPTEGTRLLASAFDATYLAGRDGSPGHLLWVARDALMAQRFDPQSGQLSGSVVAIPGTGSIAASLGTRRASVSVANDGTLLYSSGGARYQLAWFGPDGTPRETVAGIEQYIGLRLSPDGREVLATISDDAANGDLWRVDLASGARSRITSNGGGWYAVWSPDSREVAFTALNSRRMMQVANARGDGAARTIARFEAEVYPNDWAHNGQYLAYVATDRSSSHDLWLLRLDRTPEPEPLMRTPSSERHAQFSRDGRWLAFTSNATGRDDVYVQSFPGAATRQIVSGAGGAYPRWSGDGRRLFYRAPDGTLMAIAVRPVGSTVELGAPAPVMRLVEPPGVHPYPYDVAADGRILALTPASGGLQDLTLTVLMNWQRVLEP